MDKVEKARQSQIANLEEKTGKSLADWIKIVTKSKHEKHGEIVKYLKADHRLTHGYANLIALKSKAMDTKGQPVEKDLVKAQYEGKADIKEIYDAVITMVSGFGKDVELAPKMSYVSLRRNKQFAILQPSKSRLDIGLNLKEVSPSGRLEAAGSFNAMCTHRIKVDSKKQIDSFVKTYLKKAYDAA